MDLSRFKQGSADFAPAPAGVHSAVCIGVIDLGTQESSFQGKTTMQPKILIRWEIDERMEPAAGKKTGDRFMIQQRYTASMHEKAALRRHLEAWRGAPFKESDFAPGGFSMRKLLGAPCQIQIAHNERDGKTYANIAAIMKLGKGMAALKPEIEPYLLDLDAKHFDRDLYDNVLSQGLRDVIAKSPEYQTLGAKKNGGPKSEHDAAWEPEGGFDEDMDDKSVPF